MHRSPCRRPHRALFPLAVSLVLTGALGAHAQVASFSDQTASSLVNGTFSSNLHGFLAGGAVGDFDRDGWQDIFYPAGGNGADKLFMNNGDGTFADQATAWGIALDHRSTAAAVGDFNGDGWLDIYVTSLGPSASSQPGHHKLYRNNGNGTFTDVATSAGVNQTSATGADGWGAAWGDYDLDGDLDLAVAGWQEPNDGNRLFRNNGNETFTDVTTSAGLGALATGTNGFAPRFVDMDGDRYPEIIWIGDFTTGHYFDNDGDGTFTDRTGSSGTNQDGTEMGMTVADWDEDLDFDFYVTTISTNNLYINQGNHSYSNQASSAGVVNTGWGWATVSFDFDHDTLVDIIATAQGDRNYAFRNTSTLPTLSFTEVATSIGLGAGIDGRGLSRFDYDNDGDQDLIAFPRGAARVLRNDLSGPNTNWLRVFLDPNGAPGIAPDGIGSVVTIRIGTRTRIARVDGGSNYLSQSELSAHFGLGSATMVDELQVQWPDGSVTTMTNVAANQTLTIGLDLFRDGFETGDTSAWDTTVP